MVENHFQERTMLTLRQLEQEKIKSLKTRHETIKAKLLHEGFSETEHPDVLEFRSTLNFSVEVHLETEAMPFLVWDYFDVLNQDMVSETTSDDERELKYDWKDIETEAILLVRAMINGEYPETN